MNTFHPYIKPGKLEVYTGPMKCGKTNYLLLRVDKLRHMNNCDFLFIKPTTDTRDEQIKSRFSDQTHACIFVDHDDPRSIIATYEKEQQGKHIKFIAIDEAQFFTKDISPIIDALLRRGLNIAVAGLDLDFRGEPFGYMHHLLALADEVYKLTAICEYPGCNAEATRTQRLIDGQPAPYHSPTIQVDTGNEEYEARCLHHHAVPGKQ